MSKSGFEGVVEKTRDLLHDSTEAVQDGLDEASERVLRTTRQARRQAERWVRDAQGKIAAGGKRLSEAVDDATEYVVENPGKALLAASAVGFVVGFLMARRRDA